MKSSEKLVSIIITTYYRNERLQKALDHCCNQSHENIEIIVVDDSGERHAKDTVSDYDGIQYIAQNENKGQTAGWITGWNQATGDYIQFHDDDDWIVNSKLEKQLRILESDPEVGAVYCGISNSKDNILLPPAENKGRVLQEALKFQLERCQTTTMLIDAALIDAIFPLRDFRSGVVSDLVLAIELAQRTKFDFVNEPLVNRRTIGEGMGTTMDNRLARIEVVNAYESLYNRYPNSRKLVLSDSYFLLGRRYIEDPRSIRRAAIAFIKSAQYSPGYFGKQVRNLFLNFR